MYDADSPLVTLEDLTSAREIVRQSGQCIRTPMLHGVQEQYGVDPSIELHLKLETMQKTGSFKPRGLVNQLRHIPDKAARGEQTLVTISAGNYGKAFAYLTSLQKLKALVLMPFTAPAERDAVIKGYGADVKRCESLELFPTAERLVAEEGMHFMHSFDDVKLIAGFGSLGFEILEDLGDPDVVVVCCGGGCVLAGTAAAIKLSGRTKTRVYGVEPQGACAMFRSRQAGYPVKETKIQTVAAGLAPPFAGPNSYRHNKAFVDGMIVVTDDEIKQAVRTLYHGGLVVEPSGAAAFAALQNHKIPDTRGKKVVIVLTGSNMSPQELCKYMPNYVKSNL
ncbi:phenylserine dehydratase-like [Ptychodera flava]|uniref:phenylserine dehydratase-like n=1 Tax=Ptychodera flava TaxID=63121 RepID=UPI00396A4F6B